VAESNVNVTEGSGKKLHTWNRTIGANSVEDEYMLLGENALATYTVTIGPTALATANSHLLQIMAGASLKVRIRRIEVWQTAAVTAASFADFQLWRLSTAGTGGGAGNGFGMDPADPAVGATFMSLPTVKGTETTLMARAYPYLMQTVGASTPEIQPVIVWDFDRQRSKPLIIAAGTTNGIAIKNAAASAAGSVLMFVILDESSF
jgi:hypothetical protein